MVTVYSKNTLKDFEGLPLKDAEMKEITNAKIIINALLAPQAGDESLPAEEKLKRFLLARRFFSEEIVDITSEEVVLLQGLISKNYGVIIVGQMMEWLK